MIIKIPLLGFAPGHYMTIQRRRKEWRFSLLNYRTGLRFATTGKSFFDRAERLFLYVKALGVNKGLAPSTTTTKLITYERKRYTKQHRRS